LNFFFLTFLLVLLPFNLFASSNSDFWELDTITPLFGPIEPSKKLNVTKKLGIIKDLPFVFKEGNIPQFPSSIEKGKKEIKFSYSNAYQAMVFRLGAGKQMKEPVMVLNHNIAGNIYVYRKSLNSNKWQYIGRTGSFMPFDDRMVPANQVVVPLEFEEDQDVLYALLRKSHHRFDAQAFLSEKSILLKEELSNRYIYLIYMGAFLSLLLYNFFLFVSLKETIYLYYCFFGVSIHLVVLTVTGFIDFLFKGVGIAPSHHLMIYSCFSLISALLFASRYYQIKLYSKNFYKVMKVIMFLTSINLFIYVTPLNPLFGGAHLGRVIDILIPFGVVLMLAGAFFAYLRGNVMAKFYLLSWGLLFSGVFIYFGNYAGFFEKGALTTQAILWGNLAEILVVALGLAYKISILDREKKEALIMAQGKREYERITRVLLHDIGNPLNLVRHYTRMRFKKPEKFKDIEQRAWSKIQKGVEKMEEIVIFHRSHEASITNNESSLSVSPICLSTSLKEAIELFEEPLEAKKIELEIELEKEVKVMAERVTLVNEVLSNIISNALKFSFEGGKVMIKSEREADHVVLSISDHGLGVPNSVLKAFNEGKTSPSSYGTTGEKGSGFGLYLLKSYIELYGGWVAIESCLQSQDGRNHGTTVRIGFLKA